MPCGQVTGKDKLGRIKMGNHYFDVKQFQKKMDDLGIVNVNVGKDEEGKVCPAAAPAAAAAAGELAPPLPLVVLLLCFRCRCCWCW